MFINLWEETANRLAMEGYLFSDIGWIGNDHYQISFENFREVASHTDYDNGYGFAEIPTDLIIAMKDGGWFTRTEYDGKEWWAYHVQPSQPEVFVELYTLKHGMWPRLDDVIGESEWENE